MNRNGLKLVLDAVSACMPVVAEADPAALVAAHFRNANGVVWRDERVLFFRIVDGVIETTEDVGDVFAGLRSLRVFDATRELHLWRDDGGPCSGRLREDGTGEAAGYVEATQALLGTMAESRGEWSRLTEERFGAMTIPYAAAGIDGRKRRVGIRTRNYIGYDADGVAGYVDCRFVGFETMGG